MTPYPARGIGGSSIGAGTIGARLVELEQELEEAEHRSEYFQLVNDITKTMTDNGINDLRNDLIRRADSAWDVWDHTARCYAVEEFRRIEAVVLRRKLQAEKDAGIDPYANHAAPLPGRTCPDLPEYQHRDVSLIERESWGHKNYKFRHPIVISGDLTDVRSQLAGTQLG